MNLKWDQIYGETAVERGKRIVVVALFVWEMRWNEKRFFPIYVCGRAGVLCFFLAAGGLPFFGVFTLSSTPGKVKSGGGGRVSAFPETSATVSPYFFGPKIKEYQCVL